MDPPDFWDADKPSPTRRELQDPRPAPLNVSKESRKIKKPPVAPSHQPPPAAAQPSRQPVIIYSVSTKDIHTTADLMNHVQRLTGPFSSADTAVHAGDDSPAARLASIERTSPSGREKDSEKAMEIMNMVEGLDMSQMPGILSPAPASMPPVPSGFFSPEFDPHTLSWLNDLSPSIHDNNMSRSDQESMNYVDLMNHAPSIYLEEERLKPEVRKQEWRFGSEMICLDNGGLSELPENPHCPYLRKLFLQHNSDLAVIPFSFFIDMPALQVLDLSDTSIKSLPPSISSLVALRNFFMRNCQLLLELPPEIIALRNLEVLDLEGTRLICVPREIIGLVNLVGLKVSLYKSSHKYRERRGIEAIIPRATLSNLCRLNELSIDVDPDCEWWDAEVEAIIDELSSLRNLHTLKLYLPKVELLQRLLQVTRNQLLQMILFLPLMYPTLSNFRLIIGRHEQRIISCLPVDLQVEFEKLEKCLKYVNGEGSTDVIGQALKHAGALLLERHWSIEKLSVFKIDEMDKLKFCLLVECNEMGAVVDGGDFYHQRGEGRSNFNADGKPVLGLLQYLGIHYMKNLECVWKGPAIRGCLSSIRVLDLHTCPNLTTIFSSSLLCNLANLKDVTVEDCPKLKTVVSAGSCDCDFFLPSLEKITLFDLPEMVSIFSGARIAPKLERMFVYNCPNLKTLSPMETSFMKEIKGESEWWEALEWNQSEQGQGDNYLLGIFVPLKSDGELVEELAEAENQRRNTLCMLQNSTDLPPPRTDKSITQPPQHEHSLDNTHQPRLPLPIGMRSKRGGAYLFE